MNKSEWHNISKVSLRIMNAPKKHQEIEKTLRIKASREHKKGEPTAWKGKIIKGSFYKNDFWCLDAPLATNNSFNKPLAWLFKKIYPHKKFVSKLQAEGVNIDIYCSYRTDSPTGGFEIHPRFYKIISELNIPIGFAVQFDGALEKYL